jgi:hypothetical protein
VKMTTAPHPVLSLSMGGVTPPSFTVPSWSEHGCICSLNRETKKFVLRNFRYSAIFGMQLLTHAGGHMCDDVIFTRLRAFGEVTRLVHDSVSTTEELEFGIELCLPWKEFQNSPPNWCTARC